MPIETYDYYNSTDGTYDVAVIWPGFYVMRDGSIRPVYRDVTSEAVGVARDD